MQLATFQGRYGSEPDPSDISLFDLPAFAVGVPTPVADDDAARIQASSAAAWFTFADPAPEPDPVPTKRGKAAASTDVTPDAPAAPAQE